MLRLVAFTAALVLACTSALADGRSEEIVSKYIDAYNDHDIERMMALVSDDVRWLEIADDEIVTESMDGAALERIDGFVVRTKNRDELAEAIESYFDTFPGARSIIRSMQSSGTRTVRVFEEAVWDFAGVSMSQCATAIYHVNNGVITSVAYSSEQPCDDESPES